MRNPRVLLAAALFPALFLACTCASLPAQERIPLEIDKKPPEPAPPPGRTEGQPGGKTLDPNAEKRGNPGPFGQGHINGPVHLQDRGDLAKHVEIHWETDPSGKALYAPYRLEGTQRIDLKQSDISGFYLSGLDVLHTGPGTQDPAFHKFIIAKYPEHSIIHEKDSANQNQADLNWAMEVASRPVDPAKTVIFNATPQQRDASNFSSEKARMAIGGEAEDWAELNDDIARRSRGFPPARVATRAALLHEFATGTSNVILVYAHFDGATLHMPDTAGHQGVGITLADIDSLPNRSDAKDRVIVLVACSTGKAAAGDASLVSLLLKKRLARVVLATALPYDAQRIPAFLERLASGELPSQADPQLRPYVELNQDIIFRGLRFGLRLENEVTLNG